MYRSVSAYERFGVGDEFCGYMDRLEENYSNELAKEIIKKLHERAIHFHFRNKIFAGVYDRIEDITQRRLDQEEKCNLENELNFIDPKDYNSTLADYSAKLQKIDNTNLNHVKDYYLSENALKLGMERADVISDQYDRHDELLKEIENLDNEISKIRNKNAELRRQINHYTKRPNENKEKEEQLKKIYKEYKKKHIKPSSLKSLFSV